MRLPVLIAIALLLTGCTRRDRDGDGLSAFDGDCDDSNANILPGAPELCGDGIDNDCDGFTEPLMATFYPDTDGDGMSEGIEAEALRDCVAPEGYTTRLGDCDDTQATVFEGAEEVCDTLDNDCDGETDEGVDLESWADTDGDGYGDKNAPLRSCDVPSDHVTNKDDCNDRNDQVNPDIVETCNLIDDNCNGNIDEGLTKTWYPDTDGDGFGAPGTNLSGCSPGADWVTDRTDCDDTNDAVNTGATEVCNLIDDDCDGTIDNDFSNEWFVDADGDGAGDDETAIDTCDPDEGLVDVGGDCDDSVARLITCDSSEDLDGDGFSADEGDCDEEDATVNPDAVDDSTDTFDQNCDGIDGPDVDEDGFADAATGGDDCDDTNPDIRPGATEACNRADDDCDGVIDNGVTTLWYADLDEDGFGDPATEVDTCEPDDGLVPQPDDCDDAAADINPSATELCDDIDQDCDGDVANGFSTLWYADIDEDGYGDPATEVTTCEPDDGLVDVSDDCDDALAEINPGATELCDDIDQDCDGDVANGFSTLWYADIDEDGFGDPATEVTTCEPDDGLVDVGDDCDDAVAEINPSATEICDDIDQDCEPSNECDLLGSPDPTTTWQLDGTTLVAGAMAVEVDTHALVLSDVTTGNLWLYSDISTVTDFAVDFSARLRTTAVVDPTHLLAGTVDAGDDLDLVVVGTTAVQVYPGPFAGDTTPTNDYGWTLTEAPIGAGLGDLDDDGNTDLVLMSDLGGSIIAGPLDAAAGPDTADLTLLDSAQDWTPSGVAVLDLDGDGADDLALLGAQSLLLGPLTLGPNDIDGAMILPIGGTPSSPWSRSSEVYDIDGDGTSDLLLAGDGSGEAGAVQWATDAPSVLFTYDSSVEDAPHGVDVVRAGDLDGDGATDVLFGDASGAMSLFYGPLSAELDATAPHGSLTISTDTDRGANALIGDLSGVGRDSVLLFGDHDGEATLSWWNTSP